MALGEYLGCLVPEEKKDCTEALSSLGCSLGELKQIYQERIPYTINEIVGGLCLEWDEVFLALCRYAMSTDCMDKMTSQERELWRMLVDFEDANSWSASSSNCNGKADGCTDPRTVEIDHIEYPLRAYPLMLIDIEAKILLFIDDNGNTSGTTTPIIPSYPQYCLDEYALEPEGGIPKEYVYDDLDGQFYKIHECLPYNTCGCDEDYILENNDCHTPGNPPSDPDAIYDDLYKTGCGTGYCSQTVNK